MDDLMGYWETWSATKKYIGHTHTDPVNDVREKLEKAWGEPATKRLVRWPLHLRVGRKK